MKNFCHALAAILFSGSAVWGQVPYASGMLQAPYAGQVSQYPQALHLRIAGPDGMHATFFRRNVKGESFPAPVQAAFRPGYSFRFLLSDMKRFPGETFNPTIEVRGGLLTSGKVSARDFPATLLFTEEDFAKVKAVGRHRRAV